MRVSTEDQKEKAISPEVQAADCKNAILSEGYELLEIIYDLGKSGGTLNRPGIKQIMELTVERKIHAVFTIGSDRISRNTKEYLQLKDLFRDNKVALRYVHQMNLDDSAMGRTMDEVNAAFNQYHRLSTSEKVKNTLYPKAQAGYWPEYAPPGYKNISNPDKSAPKIAQKIIVPDQNTHDIISEAFKLFATGLYNGQELADMMYEKGLRNRSGKKLSYSRFYALLRNTFYVGEVHWGPVHVKEGKHTPLVDRATFNRVQTILDGRNHHACRRRKYSWLLNGFLFCYRHKCRYTAEWHLNKGLAYYHCTNRTGCGKYSEMVTLENTVAKLFQMLEFHPEFVKRVTDRVEAEFKQREDNASTKVQRLVNQKTAWEAKKKVAEIKLLEGALKNESYLSITSEIDAEIAKVGAGLSELHTSSRGGVDVIKEILSMTKDMYKTYNQASPELQKQYLSLFWNKFEVQDAVIIKSHLSPLFDELVQQHQAALKTKNPQFTGDFVSSNQVIIRNFWLSSRVTVSVFKGFLETLRCSV